MIRIGTRGSALARAQTTLVARALGGDTEIVVIRTAGDETAKPIRELGDGVFVTAIEDALRHGEIDVAVHSLKDLPTAEPDDLVIAAIPVREDPRDVLVTRHRRGRAELAEGSRVGTSSPRREALLAALVRGLVFAEIRGNVDTRIAKVERGEYDATVLAAAGLRRLGVAFGEHEALPLDLVPPAPGQGALAVQVRADDRAMLERARSLDDAPTREAVGAERELLRLLGASCEIGLGCHARREGGALVLDAALASGGEIAHAHATGADPVSLARSAADMLLELADA